MNDYVCLLLSLLRSSYIAMWFLTIDMATLRRMKQVWAMKHQRSLIVLQDARRDGNILSSFFLRWAFHAAVEYA